MDSREKAMKVGMLQEILKKDFGITSAAELIAAMKDMPVMDISIFVSDPVGRECLSCSNLTKS